MAQVRDVLNKIKWTKTLQDVEVWYLHRGAAKNMKRISGDDIITIERSFLQTPTASIPYHRVLKITYGKTILFDRAQLARSKK
ncbi:MAG: DUF504 domain-containing protein [Candidatus Thermoplasmatota archaeon]|nr:DUF504 domain-containing protein [Candidatus Thermoplasmatota archaeon]